MDGVYLSLVRRGMCSGRVPEEVMAYGVCPARLSEKFWIRSSRGTVWFAAPFCDRWIWTGRMYEKTLVMYRGGGLACPDVSVR